MGCKNKPQLNLKKNNKKMLGRRGGNIKKGGGQKEVANF